MGWQMIVMMILIVVSAFSIINLVLSDTWVEKEKGKDCNMNIVLPELKIALEKVFPVFNSGRSLCLVYTTMTPEHYCLTSFLNRERQWKNFCLK